MSHQSHKATSIEVQPTFSVLRYNQKRGRLSILRDYSSEFVINKNSIPRYAFSSKTQPLNISHFSPSYYLLMARNISSTAISQRLTADTIEDVSMIPVKAELGKWTPWSYEILVATASAISFSCFIATLHEFDGELQKNWHYRYVTRNTVIAAMSTITRASLLGTVAVSLSQNKWTWFSTSRRRCRKLQGLEIFDNASRGVAGSFRLLGTVKHDHIASLGALVTVLALGFDAFAQNILGVQYYEVTHKSNSSVGNVSRSEIYDVSNRIQDWFNKDLDFEMKATISNGILGGNIAMPLPDCSTGNCTWPVVPSLAMCGGCSNVTGILESNCTTPYLCNYSLPDGMELQGFKAGISQDKLPGFALPLVQREPNSGWPCV